MNYELISIIIPAYNESKRIRGTLRDIGRFCASKSLNYELIVVDDGSADSTQSVVKQAGIKHSRIIKNAVNMGKGYSVKRGMLEAKGDLCLFMDADNSAEIFELERLLPFIKESYSVVIGSRKAWSGFGDPLQHEVARPFRRRLVGQWSNWLIQKLIIPGVSDSQCGFKLFTRQAACDIFSRQTIHGWGFDFEILAIARVLGYKIKEVPINWTYASGSRVKLWRVFYTLYELFIVKRNLMAGKYICHSRQAPM